MTSTGLDGLFLETLQGVAEVKVKINLRDPDARFEKVVVHPMPGPGRTGLTYTCGIVRPSYSVSGVPRRFVFHHSREEVIWFGQNPRLDALSNDICEKAPLPMAAIETGEYEWRFKPQK